MAHRYEHGGCVLQLDEPQGTASGAVGDGDRLAGITRREGQLIGRRRMVRNCDSSNILCRLVHGDLSPASGGEGRGQFRIAVSLIECVIYLL